MPRPSDSDAEFTRAFRAALAGGAVPDFVRAPDPAEAASRFAVYRNNVAHSLRTALSRRFPAIRRLVGGTFFDAMAAEFVAAHPPASPVIQEWGDEFPRFLTMFPPVATLPFLADVARIEWARGRAYHAADAVPMPAGNLGQTGPLRLHPSLHLLHLDHPAVSIWQANQPDRDGRTDAVGAQIALIWRRPDFSVSVQPLSQMDGGFIAALMQGAPMAAAAVLTDPVPMLTLLLRDGLICDPGAPS
ncbi:putative DNA-binding domain-containing protein [Paracoccus stylophorae]|uniref:DNA-binding domain-containing protein n=1 Tax=Paracoccus stylophorae TaxID=659350 RepID=A0ABY7SU41_9RHOB|nr:DNA-binding domain-containing protein [Paracoccus stylophorae]WCR10559.1 putative DNA-binding domain-containing protein [Paracoccus stylophorae]